MVAPLRFLQQPRSVETLRLLFLSILAFKRPFGFQPPPQSSQCFSLPKFSPCLVGLAFPGVIRAGLIRGTRRLPLYQYRHCRGWDVVARCQIGRWYSWS